MPVAALRTWLERTVVWRVWERMLEIEFVDRSVALAGKAFVSFFPLVIVVAAFMPESVRAVDDPLGHGSARAATATRLTTVQESFASSDDVREATGVLGLVMTIFFASSFTTALQRVYFHAWRRPQRGGIGVYWRSVVCLLAVLAATAVLGAVRRRPRRCGCQSACSSSLRSAADVGGLVFQRLAPAVGRRAGAGA